MPGVAPGGGLLRLVLRFHKFAGMFDMRERRRVASHRVGSARLVA